MPKLLYFCSFVPYGTLRRMGYEMICASDAAEGREYGVFPQNLCGYVLHGEKIDFTAYDGVLLTNCCSGSQRLYDRIRRLAPSLYIFMLEVSGCDASVTNAYELFESLTCRFGVPQKPSANAPVRYIRRMVGNRGTVCRKRPHLVKRIPQIPAGAAESVQPKTRVKFLVRMQGEQRLNSLFSIGGRSEKLSGEEILVLASALPQNYIEEMRKLFGDETLIFDTCFHTDRGDISLGGGSCPACPRMLLYETYARERIRSAGAVIYIVSRYCDFSMFSAPAVARLCENEGKRLLVLEESFPQRISAHSRLRLEAFGECLGFSGKAQKLKLQETWHEPSL